VLLQDFGDPFLFNLVFTLNCALLICFVYWVPFQIYLTRRYNLRKRFPPQTKVISLFCLILSSYIFTLLWIWCLIKWLNRPKPSFKILLSDRLLNLFEGVFVNCKELTCVLNCVRYYVHIDSLTITRTDFKCLRVVCDSARVL
jgi:hypothetical protein